MTGADWDGFPDGDDIDPDALDAVVVRDGASTRTADELLLTFVSDAIDLGVRLSPWGLSTFRDLSDALEANRSSRSGTAWFADPADYDTAAGLADQVEADLSTLDAGYRVDWDDGYVISRTTTEDSTTTTTTETTTTQTEGI